LNTGVVSGNGNRSVNSCRSSQAKPQSNALSNLSSLKLLIGLVTVFTIIGALTFAFLHRQHQTQNPINQKTKIDAEAQMISLEKEALNLSKSGKRRDAEEVMHKALSIGDGVVDEHTPVMRDVMAGYASYLFFRDNVGYAREIDYYFDRVEKLIPDKPVSPVSDQVNVYHWHGIAAYHLKEYAKAFKLLSKAQSLVASNSPGQSSRICYWLERVRAHQDQKIEPETMALYDRAEQLAGENHPAELCEVLLNKASDLWDFGRAQEARKTLARAKTFLEKMATPAGKDVTIKYLENTFATTTTHGNSK
jgi:tetratricopeptide (TPR) repeat protein